MSQEIQELESTLNTVSKGLSKVTGKKMFGCHALWADGNVFALIWKTGRIGVKLPDETPYQKLRSVKVQSVGRSALQTGKAHTLCEHCRYLI